MGRFYICFFSGHLEVPLKRIVERYSRRPVVEASNGIVFAWISYFKKSCLHQGTGSWHISKNEKTSLISNFKKHCKNYSVAVYTCIIHALRSYCTDPPGGTTLSVPGKVCWSYLIRLTYFVVWI